VTVTNACLSILAGEPLTAVTLSGKLNIDHAKHVRKLVDRILAIRKDDLDESEIADESDESSKD
jgi:hypothetical protein